MIERPLALGGLGRSSTLALGLALHGWPLVRSREDWRRSYFADAGAPESLAYRIAIPWEAWAKSHGWRVETPRIPGFDHPTWGRAPGAVEGALTCTRSMPFGYSRANACPSTEQGTGNGEQGTGTGKLKGNGGEILGPLTLAVEMQGGLQCVRNETEEGPITFPDSIPRSRAPLSLLIRTALAPTCEQRRRQLARAPRSGLKRTARR